MLDKIIERAVYYSDGLKVALWCLALSPAILFASYLALSSLGERGTSHSYVPLSFDGTPLDTSKYLYHKPFFSDQELVEWADNCLFWSFSLDYKHYKRQISKSLQECFSNNGGRQFLAALKDIELLETIKDSSLIVSFSSGEYKVKHISPIEGKYAWELEVPTTLTYYTPKRYSSLQQTLSITVLRSSILEGGKPARIVRIIATD